ncbi:MAG: uroporphyrinogen-III synthase [Betaproteobacteria bacterium]|nr:uroporphyrinogen-III synthase [Betaproteobacteria bacterium]NBT09471.1 uroporphyrinogen-III synthase [Betaproteobacteria bacterium]NBU49557.1 uroporphyrinogen-III synthase [Betaproteobacteria bacterium]NBX95889.1 uroporphyrinogen-III synthase [Betaproteobacteria bacterium]
MLLVTRPREQSQDWVMRLQAAGISARPLPLLGIEPAPDRLALAQSWARVPHCRAVLFVSPNAVAGFFAEAPRGVPWPAQTLAVAPGPGTAAALMAQGIGPAQIVQPPADADQFDSESLWPELAARAWVDQEVLVVRGEGGREWLIHRWQEAGARVQTVVAYRRGAPVLNAEELRLLQSSINQPAGTVWLWSSSEALDHLTPLIQAHAPQTVVPAWAAEVQALATHPRILERAHALGFHRAQACRADFSSVVAAYNRLHREP